MATAPLNRDGIVDVHGQPLRPAAAEFLATLDRLLVVCSYYDHDHEQFQRAVERACRGLIAAMDKRAAMAVEVTAMGLSIEGQVVDPQHRSARKVNELLVALNLARLEFSRELTPPQLRAALAALQDQRLKLGRTEGFAQIVIDGLPPTVNVATRRVVAAADRTVLDDLLRDFESPASAGEADLDPEAEWRRLAREFMALADRMLERSEAQASASAAVPAGAAALTVTPGQIAALRDTLRRLLEVRPDPAELLRLIRHAKMALDLSRDPGTVDLAFRVMCHEIGGESATPAERAKPLQHEDFAFSPAALSTACLELASRQATLPPPVASALRDTTIVALCLLAEGGDSRIPAGCLDALDAGVAAPEFGIEDLDALGALAAGAAARGPAVIDQMLPPLLRSLRRHQGRRVAELWERLWPGDAGAQSALWPHLVNDLLLGLGAASDTTEMELWMEANLIETAAAPELAERLARLEALSGNGATARLGNLMQVPTARVGRVLSVLMRGPLADRLGPAFHQALRRLAGNELPRVLAEALVSYDPEHRHFYVDLARELGAATKSPRFRMQAGKVLAETLAELTPAERREDWTVTAIAWLPDLAGASARPLLAGIAAQRRFLVLKAWPAACRAAARAALADLPAAPRRAI
jgi:hypothetical protein